MIAYACDPDGAGEHWLGWGWAREMSRQHQVVLITTSKSLANLQEEAPKHGIEFHCIDVPEWLRTFSESIVGGGQWLRKMWWQRQVFWFAKRLHKKHAFDVVHQTTFHTFRIPFRSAKLGIPSVWGPIAGGETVPAGFDAALGPVTAKSEKNRGLLNHLCLFVPSVERSLRCTDRILVSNRTTLNFLPKRHHHKCLLMPANAVREEDLNHLPEILPRDAQPYQMLYAGNCFPTRAMPLVFEAIAKDFPLDWKLRIVGQGIALPHWKEMVKQLGIEDRVEFTGAVPRDVLMNYYADASILVFPALRDSGGSALLEAMLLGMPILTFDWGGPGEMVDSSSAIVVRPESPEQVVSELRSKLLAFFAHPETAVEMCRSARMRALDGFQWHSKANVVHEIYQDLVDQKR